LNLKSSLIGGFNNNAEVTSFLLGHPVYHHHGVSVSGKIDVLVICFRSPLKRHYIV